MAVKKPKRQKKTRGNDQISEELIKAGGRTPSEIRKLVHSIWNEEELAEE